MKKLILTTTVFLASSLAIAEGDGASGGWGEQGQYQQQYLQVGGGIPVTFEINATGLDDANLGNPLAKEVDLIFQCSNGRLEFNAFNLMLGGNFYLVNGLQQDADNPGWYEIHMPSSEEFSIDYNFQFHAKNFDIFIDQLNQAYGAFWQILAAFDDNLKGTVKYYVEDQEDFVGGVLEIERLTTALLKDVGGLIRYKHKPQEMTPCHDELKQLELYDVIVNSPRENEALLAQYNRVEKKTILGKDQKKLIESNFPVIKEVRRIVNDRGRVGPKHPRFPALSKDAGAAWCIQKADKMSRQVSEYIERNGITSGYLIQARSLFTEFQQSFGLPDTCD